MELKRSDKLILKELRKNSREKLTKIAKRTGVALSTVFDRVNILKKELQLRNTTLMEFGKLNYGVKAHIVVGVEKTERILLRRYLTENKKTNNLYKINNGFDFLVELIFFDIKEYEDFLEELKGAFKITKFETHIIVKDIIRERFFTKEVE